MLLQPTVERQPQALQQELVAALDVEDVEPRRADVVEGVDLRLAVAEARGEGQRLLAAPHRVHVVGGEHGELREVAEGQPELAPLRQRLQQRDGLLPVGDRVLAAVAEPGEAREPAQPVALGQAVAEGAPQLDLPRARRERLVDPIGHVALVGEGREEVRALGGLQGVGVAQGAGVEGGGLPVRRQPGSARRRPRRVVQDGLGVPGGVGVVGEAGEVAVVAAARERGERAPVQGDAARCRDRRLHREARELVPEAHGGSGLHERAARQGRLERRGVIRHEGVEHVEGHGAGHDGDGVDECPGVRRQAARAGEDGVPHGRRQIHLAGQRLGDEERVAAGAAVQLLRVEPVRGGELGAPQRPTARRPRCAAPPARSRGRRAARAGPAGRRARRRGRSPARARRRLPRAGRAGAPRRASRRRPSASQAGIEPGSPLSRGRSDRRAITNSDQYQSTVASRTSMMTCCEAVKFSTRLLTPTALFG